MLVRGLNQAASRLKTFGAGIKAIGTKMFAAGAGIITPMVAAAKMFGDAGDRMAEMSARTGIAVEELSTLGYAAKMSGADLEDMEKSVKKMQKFITAAAGGTAAANEALAEMGLTARQFVGLAPDEQMKLFADRLAAIKDPTLRAATALEIFGRGGTSMLPMLSLGARGIEALQERARSLGLQMSTEDAEAGHAFSKALETLWLVLQKSAKTIGAALTPMLHGMAQWLTTVVVKLNAWIKANPELIRYLFQMGVLVAATGSALVVLGMTIKYVGVALATIASIGKFVVVSLAMVKAVILGLLSPLGLVIGAFAGFAAYQLYATGKGGEALAWLGQRFGDLAKDATTSFDAIGNALASGDVGLAAKVLWSALTMEFQKGRLELQKIWYDLWGGLQITVAETWSEIRISMADAWLSISNTWASGIYLLKVLWSGFMKWHRDQSEGLAGYLAKKMVDQDAGNKIVEEDVASMNAGKGHVTEQRIAEIRAEAEAGKKSIDEDVNATLAANKTKLDAELAANEQVAAAAKKLAQGEHDAKLDEIGKLLAAKQDALAKEKATELAATQGKLDTATAEWQAAVKAAKALPGNLGKSDALDTKLDKFKGQIVDLEGLMNATSASKTSVAGTFNASAAWGMAAGGTAAERTAANTERTALATEAMKNRLAYYHQNFNFGS